jgi:hypothetical protein
LTGHGVPSLVEDASQCCVSEPTMRVVAWRSAFPETLVLLQEKEQ